MKKLLYLIFILFFYNTLWAQYLKVEKELITNRVIVNSADSTIYAEVWTDAHTIKANQKKTYYWFKSGQIRNTRGGYDGKLLHGYYKSFYPDKNLKEAGSFKKGIKTGKWIRWYQNGEINQVAWWDNGLLNGKLTTYNDKGAILFVQRFKNGQQKIEKEKRVKTAKEDNQEKVSKKAKKQKKEKVPKASKPKPPEKKKSEKKSKFPVRKEVQLDSLNTKP